MSARLSPALLAGIPVLIISLALLAWGIWPVGRSARQATVRLPGGGLYDLDLAWPSWMRLGDPGVIRLVLTGRDDTSPAESEPNRLAESRLDASGLAVVPAGQILEPLPPGRQAVFYWSVLPERLGELEAVAWVSLHAPTFSNAQTSNQGVEYSPLLTAQKIPVQTVSLLGLDGRSARLLGGLGIVLGMLLCLEGFLSLRYRYRRKESNDHA